MRDKDNKRAHSSVVIDLRKQAEAILEQEVDNLDNLSCDHVRHMVHELRTHQVELELQNKELRRAWEELAASRDRYTDLYDLAPVGYLTISEKGLIKKANQTAADMLNTPKPLLVGRRLSTFVISEDQDIYYHCRHNLLNTKARQCCELRMQKEGGDDFWCSCENKFVEDSGDGACIRTVISDIGKQKQAELELHEAQTELENKVQVRTSQLARANKELQKEIVEHQRAGRELEESIRRQDIMNVLLQLSLEDFSLEELLHRIVDHIITFPGLELEPSGVIFLKEKASEYLEMKAHVNVPEDLLRVCSRRRIGECLCGRAALTGEVVFATSSAACHEVTYRGIHPHGHYCVPILGPDNAVLGVIALFLKNGAFRNKAVEETLIAAGQVIAGIIERTKAKTALHEKTELVSSIYAAADNVALITTDLAEKNTQITSFSPGAEQMFGYSREEAVGQQVSLLNTPEKAKSILETISRLRSGQKVYFQDTVLVRKSGEPFAATVTIHPLSNGCGKVIGTLGVCLDISDLKLAQAELQRTNEELEQRVEQRTLELQRTQQQFLHMEKLGAIGRLSASIAHEFNNPMQGILTVLNGIAKRATLEDEDLGLVRSAIEECQRIKGLIRDLQDFNRPTSGKRESMDLRKAIDTLLLLCKSDCKHRKIKLVTEYAEDTPFIMAIPDQIKQVILNLLNNAADACPDGGTIHISTWAANNAAILQIRDTGVGIKPENLDRIFEPFFTTKSDVKGNGLGLSVSFGIIKQHKGTLEVESKPGKGATFTITLPVMGALDGA